MYLGDHTNGSAHSAKYESIQVVVQVSRVDLSEQILHAVSVNVVLMTLGLHKNIKHRKRHPLLLQTCRFKKKKKKIKHKAEQKMSVW